MQPDTKTTLLDIAEKAARSRGFDGFSYGDLAQAAGIRKASIHYHFATKAVLSAALMDRYHASVEQVCTEIEATHQNAADRLAALVAFYRNALGGGETLCLCVAFTISRDSLADEVKDKIVAFRAMMTTWITALFELGKQDGTISAISAPEAEAHATLATLEGAHLAAHAEQNLTAFDKATRLLLAR
ncbi:TetR/AcrR family transcriptional regulator [Sulfitobacter geojensis]|uniref:TetR/AcrR family transcriptional regulator n=2 Tax=Sulfitobacter geojensis TaxID=1342299 RepID=UPI00055C101E|nr:TetR/AcrR family transcriptional regulator [Sulfitobacter geojensis]KHA52466.1 Transcriptional regulator, TetR family [Sulfitobacter geojensis]